MPIDTETPTLLCDGVKTNKVEADETVTAKLILGPSAAYNFNITVPLSHYSGNVSSNSPASGFNTTYNVVVNVVDLGCVKFLRFPKIDMPYIGSNAFGSTLLKGFLPLSTFPNMNSGFGDGPFFTRAEIHQAKSGLNPGNFGGYVDNGGPYQLTGYHRIFTQGGSINFEMYFDGYRFDYPTGRLLTIQLDDSGYENSIVPHTIIFYQN